MIFTVLINRQSFTYWLMSKVIVYITTEQVSVKTAATRRVGRSAAIGIADVVMVLSGCCNSVLNEGTVKDEAVGRLINSIGGAVAKDNHATTRVETIFQAIATAIASTAASASSSALASTFAPFLIRTFAEASFTSFYAGICRQQEEENCMKNFHHGCVRKRYVCGKNVVTRE
jgi:hypothetical protein